MVISQIDYLYQILKINFLLITVGSRNKILLIVNILNPNMTKSTTMNVTLPISIIDNNDTSNYTN